MSDVTVKLSVGSFTAEVTGPAEYVDQKIEDLANRFLKPSALAMVAEQPSSHQAPEINKRISPAEFLKKRPGASQPDRAVMLGYYIEKHQQTDRFTTSELQESGRAAKDPFGNISDVVAKLVARGLMMTDGDKDGQRAYSLTASGEAYVDEILRTDATPH